MLLLRYIHRFYLVSFICSLCFFSSSFQMSSLQQKQIVNNLSCTPLHFHWTHIITFFTIFEVGTYEFLSTITTCLEAWCYFAICWYVPRSLCIVLKSFLCLYFFVSIHPLKIHNTSTSMHHISNRTSCLCLFSKDT